MSAVYDAFNVPSFTADDFMFSGQITPPGPDLFNADNLLANLPTLSAADFTLPAGVGASSLLSKPGAIVVAGGAALALAILLFPTPTRSRRR